MLNTQRNIDEGSDAMPFVKVGTLLNKLLHNVFVLSKSKKYCYITIQLLPWDNPLSLREK